MQQTNIQTILENLGLTKRQAKIYLYCLEYGPISVTKLSKTAHEKKATTFDTVKLLEDKNFLISTYQGNKRMVSAEDPKIIESIYEEKFNDFKKAVPFLGSLKMEKDNKPTIKYYEGRQGIKHIFEDMLNYKQNYYFGSVQEIVDLVGYKYLNSFIGRRKKRGIHSKALRYKEGEIKKDYLIGQSADLREIRYLSHKILSGSSLSIYGNKVAFMSTLKEGFGFVVESQEFSQMIKNFFNLVWEMSTPAGE